MTTTIGDGWVRDHQSIGFGPAELARLAEIALVLGRYGVGMVARRGPGIVLRPQDQAPRAAAAALRRSFVELGPTFVKFGQLIASSPGLFPGFLAEEFRDLLDDVPPEPTESVRRVIERQFGASIQELFAVFDDRPVAAASIAQVHRAELADGTVVAVKVRRPGLRRRVEADLRLLRLTAGALQHAGALGDVLNPVAVVDDLADSLRIELDFRNEAAAMTEFAQNLTTARSEAVVPRAIAGMTGERVLVMTFVDGTPVDDGAALRAAGYDLVGIVRAGVRSWLGGALTHGLFHGDVHAGNLFVTPAGKVAFLDFGIMGRLDERTRSVLRRALPALLIDGDFETVVRAVFDLGAATGPVDVAAATEDVRLLLAPLASKTLAEISYGEVFGHILSVASTYRVRLPRELVLVVKQLVYFERYAKELAPDYAILADPEILGAVIAPPAAPAKAPVLSAPPLTRPLERPGSGMVVESRSTDRFSWDYQPRREELARLYDKAKRSQWNAATDVDWSIDVDPLDTGGLASYLPMVAAESFARFNADERAEAARQFNAWITSQFLHGEQGALLATAKLVREVPWMEAKYYGATQVIDEARHVETYARYLDEKLQLTYPVNENLARLLELVVADSRWDVTYLGMQIIVEGIALAAFGLIHQYSNEALIKQITRYVMADEARHVAFGAL